MDVEASTEAAPRELIPDESDRPEVVQNTYNEAPTRSTLGEDECIGRRAFQFNDHSGNFRPESKCHMAVDLGVLWHCQLAVASLLLTASKMSFAPIGSHLSEGDEIDRGQ